MVYASTDETMDSYEYNNYIHTQLYTTALYICHTMSYEQSIIGVQDSLIFVLIMRGEYDPVMKWPFEHMLLHVIYYNTI